ncbi:MAG: hypothetical protein IPJ98_04990 [Bryobacterales bacterium]|nr:hypothetical protein [Bryobacterales bacterium]
MILPKRTLAARIRSLLADRNRFSQFLRRESNGVLEAAESLLGERGALTGTAAQIRIRQCLAGAWREEATLTAELCDSAITPLDGEDLRALACLLTSVVEALDDVQAAASRSESGGDWPLNTLCRATLEYVTVVCELIPEPLQLTHDASRMALLTSRSMALRSARRFCESAVLDGCGLSACQVLARWSLLEEFRRLRCCLDEACLEVQRVVLKNS